MNDLEHLTALRDADAEPPRPDARADARRALLTEAARGRGRPLRRRRSWLLAPIGAVVAAAVLLAVVTGIDSGDVTPVSASARAALERAARAAQSRPDLNVGPGKFLYIRERDAYLSIITDSPTGWSTLTPQMRETWVGRDGSVRVATRSGRTEFPGPRDRARWRKEGRPDVFAGPDGRPARYGPKPFIAGGSSLNYDQLAALPSGGEAMYHRLIELARDAGPSPDREAFVIIGDLLRGAPVPANVRAGLYRAAAYIKGIRFVGRVTDPLGRRGLAVDLAGDDGTRNRLVFDPDTSELLAEEEVLTRRVPFVDAGPGFAIGSRVLLDIGVVDSDTRVVDNRAGHASRFPCGASCASPYRADRGDGAGVTRPPVVWPCP